MANHEKLIKAIADNFDCTPEEVLHYAVVAETIKDDQLNFSWSWSGGSGIWQIKGLVAELWHQLKKASV